MPTIEEIRAKIQRNFPNQAQSDAKRQKLLTWDRRTATTMISTCGRFLIAKAMDGAGGVDYTAFSAPGAHDRGRKICGPFLTAKECRDAVQDYVNGMPMQADLT
jgi:hypothetical protein